MATVVANKMKSRFGESLALALHLVDAPEASNYVLRGSTTVFLNDEWVPLDIATSAARMQEYLEQALAKEEKV